jgi:hypothetical protein
MALGTGGYIVTPCGEAKGDEWRLCPSEKQSSRIDFVAEDLDDLAAFEHEVGRFEAARDVDQSGEVHSARETKRTETAKSTC